MPKFRDYFRQMLEENEEVFSEFALVHQKYAKNKQKCQKEYNDKGAPIKELIREWEGKLCGHTEKGEYAKYSVKLAEKFQQEVKEFFPLIDFIGVEVVVPAKKVSKQSEIADMETVAIEEDEDILEIEKIEVLDDFVIKKLF